MNDINQIHCCLSSTRVKFTHLLSFTSIVTTHTILRKHCFVLLILNWLDVLQSACDATGKQSLTRCCYSSPLSLILSYRAVPLSVLRFLMLMSVRYSNSQLLLALAGNQVNTISYTLTRTSRLCLVVHV